jgi:hypothetical protein
MVRIYIFPAVKTESHQNQPQPKEDIKPTAFTLRFKHGRHTVLLFAEPLTPFSTIKTDLLNILHERYPQGLPSSASPTPTKIPTEILDMILGVPIDVYEPSKGWTELATSGGGIKESPKSLGLKDGSVVAFAFVNGEDRAEKEGEFIVEWSSYEDQYPEEEMAEE